ncbi:MAG TPA: hypothetical protein VFN47_13520 [Pedococcus sp.]|nr:hypothetical protein [Pedococcus sp.]
MTDRRYAARMAAVGGLAALALAACGGEDSAATATPQTTTSSASPAMTTTTTPASRTTSTAPRRTPTKTASKAPATVHPTPRRTTAAPPKKSTPTHAAAPRPVNTCRVPSGVTAPQVVLVDSSGSAAAVRACRRTGSGYTTDLGPYYGHVGRNGVTSSKHEGDMSTPAGVFPLRGGFGVYGNPGLGVGSWLRVDAADVWVDDSSSSLYNTHQRTPAGGRWASAEELYNQPAYNYAQIVGYNEARTPGLGSAIFFHVDKGAGTAGCISLPTQSLLAVFRWERSGAVMAIR